MIHQTPPYDDTPTYRRRVVIKFHDDVPIPYEAGAERFVEEYGLGPWQELADAFPGITIRPKFTAVSPATLRDLVE